MTREPTDAPRPVDRPEPGFFRMKLIRGGPFVAARIGHDTAGWWAEIDGQRYAPHPDPAHAEAVYRVWHGGHVIPEAEYQHLLAVRGWAEREMPTHPVTHPREPIDDAALRRLPPII